MNGEMANKPYRRLYPIDAEPMKCSGCHLIMQIGQAEEEPDDDGHILCLYCKQPLEPCIDDGPDEGDLRVKPLSQYGRQGEVEVSLGELLKDMEGPFIQVFRNGEWIDHG